MKKQDILLRLIGVLLVIAASLKIWGLTGFQAISSRGVFANAGLQVTLVYVEMLLGLWFIFSPNRGWRWLAAVILFVGFGSVNLYQSLEGQATCSCFGPIRTNPWYVFTADVAILVLLVFLRPHFAQDFLALELRRYSIVGFGGIVLFGVFASAIYLGFGTFDRAAAYLRQESYSISPSIVDFGSGDPGEIKTSQITFTNWSDKPMRIVGGSATCEFVSSDDLPVIIEPSESQTLNLRVAYPPVAGRFDHQGHYYLDADGLTKVYFRVTGFSNGAK